MRKVITGILIGIVLMVALVQANKFIHIEKYIYANKFRFERFTTAEELIDYIKAEFPTGSDGWKLKALLEEAGASCEVEKSGHYTKKVPGAQFLYQCEYGTGWISLSPLANYSVTIYLSREGALLNFMVGKYKGFY